MAQTQLTPLSRERLETVRDTIAANKRQFVYATYFNSPGTGIFTSQDPKVFTDNRDCGTAACVAGWTFYLYPELCIKAQGHLPDRKARDVLGLSEAEATFLFHRYSSVATANDAIRRIDWLLDGNNSFEYDYAQEEWALEQQRLEKEQLEADLTKLQ